MTSEDIIQTSLEIPKTTPIIELDWMAYYLSFKELHGDPVLYKGKLIFADGWSYSSSDYAGPEWPPPRDKLGLNLIQTCYWAKRREVVLKEYYALKQDYDALKELAANKSLPLQQVIAFYTGELTEQGFNKVHREIKPIDLTAIKGRIEWLTEDILSCEAKLRELK